MPSMKILRLKRLIVFGILLGGFFYVTHPNRVPCDCPTNPVYEVTSELNGRENLRWAQLKIGPVSFASDAALDNEIVTGTTGGGWNTDLGADYTWTVAPAAAGGTISFQSGAGVALTRTAATLNSPGTWQ